MNKKIIFWGVLIVVALTILFFALNSDQVDFKKDSCPEGITPENVNFLHGIILFEGEDSYSPFFQIQGSWADGKGMEDSSEYSDMIDVFFRDYEIPTRLGDCIFGQKDGENINYLYCVPKIYTSDKLLDKDGNIIESNIKYKVYLTLEPLAKVDWEGNWIASKFNGAEGDYEIINPYPENQFENSKHVILNTKVVYSRCERIE
jgi:hypothetical protein